MELIETITCRIHWEQYSSSSFFYTSCWVQYLPRMQCAVIILLPFCSSNIIFWRFCYLNSIEIQVDSKGEGYYVCPKISTHFEQNGCSVSCLLKGPNLWDEICNRPWGWGGTNLLLFQGGRFFCFMRWCLDRLLTVFFTLDVSAL